MLNIKNKEADLNLILYNVEICKILSPDTKNEMFGQGARCSVFMYGGFCVDGKEFNYYVQYYTDKLEDRNCDPRDINDKRLVLNRFKIYDNKVGPNGSALVHHPKTGLIETHEVIACAELQKLVGALNPYALIPVELQDVLEFKKSTTMKEVVEVFDECDESMVDKVDAITINSAAEVSHRDDFYKAGVEIYDHIVACLNSVGINRVNMDFGMDDKGKLTHFMIGTSKIIESMNHMPYYVYSEDEHWFKGKRNNIRSRFNDHIFKMIWDNMGVEYKVNVKINLNSFSYIYLTVVIDDVETTRVIEIPSYYSGNFMLK